MNGIRSISIIGSGKVASHLGHALSGLFKVKAIYSPNLEHRSALAEELFCYSAPSIDELPVSDLFLVCVNDDAIDEVVNQISDQQKVAYTSGAVKLEDLRRKENLGVLYPLQSFSEGREIDLKTVPFFIEATDDEFAQELFDLATMLSRQVVYANSEDRKNLHLAAVMVNNFTNHMVHMAKDYLKDKSLEWRYLKPLLLETAMKLQSMEPEDAQTGPAIRGDQETINGHLSKLNGESKEIYRMLSENIRKLNKR